MQLVCGIHALIVQSLPVSQSWELFYLLAAFPVRLEAGVGRGKLDTALWPHTGAAEGEALFP